MRALLTDEQELLRDTVEHLANRTGEPVPELGADQPTDDWPKLVEMGVTAIATPDRDGLGGVDVAVVCEALGRHLSPLAYLGSCVLPTALLADAESKHAHLDELADGRRIAVAFDRDLADVLTGPTGVAFDAAGAAGAIVAAGDRLALAPLAREQRHAIDLTRATFDVVVADDRPAVAPRPPARASRWRTLATIGLCADMVGVMSSALDRAVSYASHRRQFGRPIGSFQAIQQLCAEQHVRVESARSTMYYAAWAIDHLDADEAWSAARAAKIYVGEAARMVAEAAIQVHGGIGMTWESDLHVHLRRIMLDRQVLGSPATLLHQAAMRFGNQGSDSKPDLYAT